MAVSKVVYGTTVLVDLTSDTVSQTALLNGTTAHDKAGNLITGNLVVQKYYTGSSDPSSSLGNNGDLSLKV